MSRNNLPEEIQAQVRRELGLSAIREVVKTARPHPSRGGSAGYDQFYRDDQLAKYDAGDDFDVSIASIYRWIDRIAPYRCTGNKQRETIVGQDQLYMAIFLFAYPDAEADEIATYIYDSTGNVYSRPAISKRMKELHLSKKKHSTEAYQAFTPENLRRKRWFWTQPPPLGVVGISRRQLWDADEAGIELTRTNRTSSHGYTAIRIRKPGHYTKNTKLTIIMAVEAGNPDLPPEVDGSTMNPRRIVKINRKAGTTAEDFAEFCDELCQLCERDRLPQDSERIISMDNLSSHRSPLVAQAIEGRDNIHARFRRVFRPPYQPKFGPIEYVFCELVCRLRQISQSNWTEDTLHQEIRNVTNNLGRNGGFDATFDHCGYEE